MSGERGKRDVERLDVRPEEEGRRVVPQICLEAACTGTVGTGRTVCT